MSISFSCPHCGKPFTVGDQLGGKKAQCKQCGGMMNIPRAEPPEEELLELEDAEPEGTYDVASPTLVPRPSPPRSQGWKPPRTGYVPPRDSGSSGKKGLAGVGGTAFVVLMIVLRVALRLSRDRGPANPGPVVPPPQVQFAPAAAPPANVAWISPVLPERGQMRPFAPGVLFQEIKIGPGAPRPGLPPAHGMTIYFYLPEGNHAPGSLPCVAIAPAGSILITGMELGEGDQAEHVPYVKAGFAVISYSLDGHLRDLQTATNAELATASREFLASKSGLLNARVALDWLAAKVPEVDPNRVFAAGHSSAGTVSLLLAENEPRIKKAVAFAPRTEIRSNFPAAELVSIRRFVPWIDQFFTAYNPREHVSRVSCPILLFHSRDDDVVPVSESRNFAQSLKAAGKDVRIEEVARGGHYDPMIRQGIPLAIRWFREN